jgi:hypothetical protein
MRNRLGVALGLSLALSAAGCGDYLSGPGLSSDPNNILTLTRPGPFYVSIQLAAPREVAVEVRYVQQVAGIARGARSGDAYQITPAGMNDLAVAVYGGGGLLDIHKVQQLARKLGDSLYIGIAKVYQALVVGYAAGVWGDIPYRQAADSTIPQPHFDPQLQVYGDIQAQLDSAIDVFLKATGPGNAGPSSDGSELIYGGRDAAGLRAVYTAVARSLKARFFLHVAAASTAAVSGAPPAAYDSAFKYATAGISSTADDFLWFHEASPTGTNGWWLSNVGDIAPGAAIVEIMKRRMIAGVEDTLRIAFYFRSSDGGPASAAGANFAGFRPAGAIVTTSGGINDGSGPYSDFGTFLDQNVSDGSFREPEISYAETQLIAAEAAWHIHCPGCAVTTVAPAAQPFLDAARHNRHYGSTSAGPVVFGDAPGALPASLQSIIEEKYVTLFLNPEVWSDWKRTCLPSLAPAPGTAGIAGRLPYGLSEINGNPNVPSTSSAGVTITSVSRNPNQPNACPVLNYVNSSPLAN